VQLLTRKRTGVAILVILTVGALAQAIQPAIPAPAPTKGQGAWNTSAVHPRVAAILKRACADCHSNETVWPWYARLSPGSWLMASHVERGRRQLNLSIEYTLDEEEIGAIYDVVDSGTMPPPSYLLLHPNARLFKDDKDWIKKWWLGELSPQPAE